MKSIQKCGSITTLWAALVAEELVRLGVKVVCIAPGSRSTALVAACARRPELEKVVCQDERSAGFFALGYGRATQKPAALIVTSGSAVANLWPSVVEASNDRIPMLLLTADRPPELRAVGANQTIDQTKIFGAYTRFFADLPVPDVKISLRYLLSTLDEAYERARLGPAHLNFMLREPFGPDVDETWDDNILGDIANWRLSQLPLTQHLRVEKHVSPLGVAQIMNHAESGIIVAGAIRDESAEQAVLRLAEVCKWPILPDVVSNLRFANSGRVAHFADFALLNDKLMSRTSDVVLQFGGRIVSKRLQSYLDKGGTRAHIYVDDNDARLDPGCVVTHRIETDVESFADALSAQIKPSPDMSPLWLRDSKIVESILGDKHADRSLSEITVARTLLAHMDDSHFLFCASSMPIRDLNMFSAPHPNPPRLYANRGASGIDGIVSTACGVSKALQKPGVLLSGDLTFVHDTNGLSLLKSLRDPLTIVVINNKGGGIFTMLDIHKQRDIFTPYFDAEHDTDIAGLCQAYQIKHRRVNEMSEWMECLEAIGKTQEHAVIEVMSDKWKNKEVHDAVREAIRDRFRG